MRCHKFLLVVFSTLLLTVSQSFWLNFPSMFGEAVVAQTPTSRKQEADTLFQQGIKQYQTSQFEAALQSWQQALHIYQEIKDRQGEGKVLGNLGVAYKNLGDYPKAIEYYKQSLAIAQEIKDRQGEGKVLGNLGVAYDSLGNYPKAIEYLQQDLAITREIKDRQGEGAVLGNLGVAYNSLGNYPKAIEYYKQSLAIAREIKNRQSEGKALGNLGIAYDSLGDYPKAIEYHQQHLAIAREIKDRQGEGNALGNLGNAYYSLGDYPKAIEYHQQDLAIAREIKDRQSQGATLGNLGIVYNDLGDYPKAIEYYQQQLTIAREIKDRQGEGNALGNLGNAYKNLGDYPKAIEYHQQDLAIAREIKDRQSQGKSLGNLGLAYEKLGDYLKAIEYHQQHLAIAREIKDRQSQGKSLGNLGVAYYSLGDYLKAIEYQQQWLTIAREIKDRQSQGNALNNLGLAFYKQGNLTLAESNLIEGIKVLESLRGGLKDSEKVSIFDTQGSTYRILQQVYIAQHKTDAALEIAERGRARAFVELLTSRLQTTNSVANIAQQVSVAQIKQIAQNQKATLVPYSIIYDYFKVQGKEQYKESELYIWVIKPTGEITFRKADLKPLWQKENITLNDLVDNTRLTIGVRSRAAGGIIAQAAPGTHQTEKLQKLHQLLIKPIANLLPNDPNNRVIFIPQSGLFLVPFPALKDEKGKFLIEKHTILTAPSIQVLDLTHLEKQRTQMLHGTSLQNVLVVGNPTMPSVPPTPGEPPQQLPSLPGAELEALDIAQQFNTHAIIGKQATKKAIAQKMPSAQIIHFATHGILDDYRGLGSSLAFAPEASPNSPPKPGEINGLLTAEEILGMKLQAELVVLSACDTGRGRITGDGVIGLSRSFITALVPSIMVSLWSVPDAPTASLMTQFYTNFKQHRMDKAQALRQAMLTILKKHPSPRDWAAFTLIGESE